MSLDRERSIMIIPGAGPAVSVANCLSIPIIHEASLKESKAIVITVGEPDFNHMQSYPLVLSTGSDVASGDANAGVIIRLHYDGRAPVSLTDPKSIMTFCTNNSLTSQSPVKAELFFTN